MAYTPVTTSPQITLPEPFSTYGGEIISTRLQWQQPLSRLPSFSGFLIVPTIPKGLLTVAILLPQSGPDSGSSIQLYNTEDTYQIDINGRGYENVFHIGGALTFQNMGNEGIAGAIAVFRFVILGQATPNATT